MILVNQTFSDTDPICNKEIGNRMRNETSQYCPRSLVLDIFPYSVHNHSLPK